MGDDTVNIIGTKETSRFTLFEEKDKGSTSDLPSDLHIWAWLADKNIVGKTPPGQIVNFADRVTYGGKAVVFVGCFQSASFPIELLLAYPPRSRGDTYQLLCVSPDSAAFKVHNHTLLAVEESENDKKAASAFLRSHIDKLAAARPSGSEADKGELGDVSSGVLGDEGPNAAAASEVAAATVAASAVEDSALGAAAAAGSEAAGSEAAGSEVARNGLRGE